jgi:addiction module RelE/StbE family toxin
MIVVYDNNFIKSAKKLPPKLKIKLDKLIDKLKVNPFHTFLHTKHLSGQLSGLLSFRITRDWRVIFKFVEPDLIQLVETASRKDIYRK